MVKKKLFKINFVFLGLLVLLISISFISSLENRECVVAKVTDISPSSIKIDEEFTIGVQIENCGSVIPNIVSFELINPPEDITIKESLTTNISRLYYGNSERFITYHMKTNNDAIPGTHVIKTRLSYGKDKISIIKEGEISFEVIGEESELGIASIKTDPVLPIEGDTVELILRIENAGEGTAKSVKLNADHEFKGLRQSFIGTLEPEEDGPAVLTFIVEEEGEFDFPVTIFYYDDFGENEIKTNISISVLEKPSNIGGIIFGIIIFGLIGGGVFYFFKIKKSKDKIIHQLLKGKDSK